MFKYLYKSGGALLKFFVKWEKYKVRKLTVTQRVGELGSEDSKYPAQYYLE